MTVKVITFGAIVLLLGCSHEPPAEAPAAAAATAAHTVAAAKDEHGHAAPHGDDHGEGAKDGHGAKKNKAGGKEQAGSGFAVPFVWETSKTDPLAVARGHLKEMLQDNAAYVSAKGKLDPSKITGRARTTIVTCSDAAVQLDALDATPENDTFVTRNWGNLLEPSLGTITYGIEELHTPVLLVVGHTGCEAVKAVLGGTKFSKPVRSQISKLKVTASGKAVNEAEAVNEAVVDNVNAQVAKAVERFQPAVRAGELTVIGAIYDPTNTLKRGQGRLSIVNVNTITDPVSMAAFVTAVTNDDKIVQAVAREHDSEHGSDDPSSHGSDEHGANEHKAAAHGASAQAAGHATAGHATAGNEALHTTAKLAHDEAKLDAHGHSPVSKTASPTHAPAPKAAANGTERKAGAHGLPQIDHLEPSLIGETHRHAEAAGGRGPARVEAKNGDSAQAAHDHH